MLVTLNPSEQTAKIPKISSLATAITNFKKEIGARNRPCAFDSSELIVLACLFVVMRRGCLQLHFIWTLHTISWSIALKIR